MDDRPQVTPELVTDGVARTTHLFQERVPCAYPVRLTMGPDGTHTVWLDTPQRPVRTLE
ncbi:hypothetical protein SAMN04487904_101130 [Actinopolyspora lacussalsi subsp. righensis]|uniref:Uncharacterized protein n=1 Tax=Actinopolyspora righensis TaxID=995060 RepID=A0A1I6X405_9ACTN|nr:hypothetical protein [Actinopolyspora righensis]SFT32916.1 hypothetical protein SAMN04487904_101130 [Actinopolyspora righensis]